MVRAFIAALAATMAFALVGGSAVGLPSLLKNKYESGETKVVCTDGNGNDVGEVVYGGPLKMWPPNHKYQPVTVTATAYDADDSVQLGTAGTHDEYAEDGTEHNGAGNTDNDVNPAADSDGFNKTSAATAHELRSERSGRGDGRTYTLDWEATFRDDDGGRETVVCGSRDINEDEAAMEDRAAFQVEVPHDMRCGADWKGGNKGSGGKGQCAKS